MRQGNGSDLLGANDPRSATIGVIYVAPNDDKESVLAAVLTQEKLGRKQIAIVLPGQNKAFQRPGDFDDLKNMRRKLQAQLIIVAPQGSSPAEFARQRRFTFFSSLESYAKSLRDESEASRSGRRGLFGSRRPSSREENGNGAMPPPPPPSGLPDEQREPPNVIPPAAVIGVAGFVAGQEMPRPEEHPAVAPLQPNQQKHDDEDVVFFPPPPPGNAAPEPEEVPLVPPPPLPPPVVVPYVDEDAHAVEGDVPGENDDEAVPPPVIPIVPYPYIVPVDNDEEEPEPVRPILLPTPIPLRQSTGPRRAVAGGVVGGAVVPPPSTTSNGGSGGSRRKRSRWQLLLLFLIALLLLSLLLCGGIALAAPGALSSAVGSLQKIGSNVIGAPPTATVNIEPKSAQLVNTYIISGLPSGTPDSSQRQVAARQVTFTSQPQSKTVAATGQQKTVGTTAIGTISFINGTFSIYYVKADTAFTDARGIQIANDSLVAIPAGNPNTGYGHVTVLGHALNIGKSGNIAAGDITNLVCCGSASVEVTTNGAFTGGQDPQNYTVVQQSDLDNVANPLKPPLLQSALTSVNGLRHTNEQFVKNAQCSTKVISTPNVGDKATSVTVSTTATCSGEVYDQVGAETIAANLLNSEEEKDLGRSYALSGTIATSVTSVSADSKGRVSLLVKANGLWIYQFDAAAKANLAKLIAGKSQNDATSLLLLQAGVSKVDSVSLSSGGTTLPTDPTQITITIVVPPVTVPGSPTVSPGSGSPSPTSENGRGQVDHKGSLLLYADQLLEALRV